MTWRFRVVGVLLAGWMFGLAGRTVAAPEVAGSMVDLSGPWRLKIEPEGKEAPAGVFEPTFDDSNWAVVQVPGDWDYQGFPKKLGKGWLRRVVDVPAAWQGKPLALQLPPADDADRTFFNGKKIGGMPAPDFRVPRLYAIPPELVKWGGPNVIVVEIENKYQNGGFTKVAPANLITVGPFVARPRPQGEAEIFPLEITPGTAEELGKLWVHGWRDEGTADTRPGLKPAAGPKPGDEALELDVKFPNASEFVDCRLPFAKHGAWWFLRGADFIAFDVQTDDTEGEMHFALNQGGYRWGKSDKNIGHSTTFRISPGGWRRVVLPFREFAFQKPTSMHFMTDTEEVTAISLGNRYNELQRPGKIRFANFAVGRITGGPSETVPLEGFWMFSKDEDDVGLKQGWEKPGFEDSGWIPIAASTSWERQKVEKYDGIGWFRQRAIVPASWKDLPLRLQLGAVSNFVNNAEVFVNGHRVGKTTPDDKDLDFLVPPGWIKAGEANTLAVRIEDRSQRGGLLNGPFVLEPMPLWVEMREAGSSADPVVPSKFAPGALPGRKNIELFLRTPSEGLGTKPLSGVFEITDCFHRVVVSGTLPLEAVPGKPYRQVRVSLDVAQSRRLFFSEQFDARILVLDAAGDPVVAGTQRELRFPLAERDALALAPLPETFEDTPYGRLKLVDVIDASQDPALDEHPYKEGGIRKSWVGRRAFSTWEKGVTVEEFQGRKYRQAANNEWFGYRVGRGVIKPGKAYVMRIEYPEDKTRYAVMNIDAGRNYMGSGFKTGVSADNPFDNYPLGQKYDFHDYFVVPDETTYGFRGSRTAPATNGFWVFFFDAGRSYFPQYQAGPGVAQIRLYEMPDDDSAFPVIDYPKGQPHRWFIADWEREPEWVAKDVVRHAKMMGFNGISPSLLKWGRLAYWHVKGDLGVDAMKPVRDPLPPEETAALDAYYAATKEAGLAIFPRLEYGGTEKIPENERAVGPNGGPAKPNRFARWCADLLQPVTFQEFSAILQETVGDRIKNNPQIAGIMFRIRSHRLPMSFSRFDIEMFSRETGRKPPEGLDDKALAQWASGGPVKGEYAAWWHAKRRDFHEKIVAQLRQYRPDLFMLYYNWDEDGWNLGAYKKTPQDYTDLYNVHTAIESYRRSEAYQKSLTPEDYVKEVREEPKEDLNVRAELYAKTPGFALLGPLNWHYLADNAPYLEAFRTGQQLALTKMYNYEERGRWNVQDDNYESSELTTGGRDFAMAEQTLAVFHGDPWILTETAYTYGWGFADQYRRFAKAFLSLPATPGEILEKPTTDAQPDLRVRRYPDGAGARLGIVHKGYQSADYTLSLPGPWPESPTVKNVVTGDKVDARIENGRLVFSLSSPPLTLHSFQVQ
jgi:hypothetical protein